MVRSHRGELLVGIGGGGGQFVAVAIHKRCDGVGAAIWDGGFQVDGPCSGRGGRDIGIGGDQVVVTVAQFQSDGAADLGVAGDPRCGVTGGRVGSEDRWRLHGGGDHQVGRGWRGGIAGGIGGVDRDGEGSCGKGWGGAGSRDIGGEVDGPCAVVIDGNGVGCAANDHGNRGARVGGASDQRQAVVVAKHGLCGCHGVHGPVASGGGKAFESEGAGGGDIEVVSAIGKG